MIGKAKNIIKWLVEQAEEYEYEVKEYKEKRSLNANGYFYKLQNQLATVLKTSNKELHLELLKRYSDCMLVPLPVLVNPKGYFLYYEEYQKAVINDVDAMYYKVYKPTREMNTKEFSRMIDGLANECRDAGIPTLEDKEIQRLIDKEF